jgi:FemAB-related protein (PEP-CTERM system-associated)
MPFLNYGGPLGTPSAQAFLAEQAVEEASRSGADLLELRARQTLPSGLRVSDRKITVLLDLPLSPESLWDDVFRAKLRSQIRRPQREGMEVRFGTSELEPFYEVFTRNMRDLGTPVLPRELFDRIGELFAGIVRFGVVYLRDEPVAAGCGFLWRGELEMTWASAIRKYNRLAPNMLLYWSFIEEAIGHRASVFNFGRCSPGGGTHRFKLQWGGRDVPLPWAQWSPRGVAATPSPDRLLYRLASGAWSRMPLPLANRIGPVLARRLP